MGNSASGSERGEKGDHDGVEKKSKVRTHGAAVASSSSAEPRGKEGGEVAAEKSGGRRGAPPAATGSDIRHAISLYDGETLPEDFAEVGRQLFCRCARARVVWWR